MHSLERTFHRCFLPSFSSFGWGFSEEKIKMWKVNGWQTTDTKSWQKLILPLARFVKKNIKMWIATYTFYRCFLPSFSSFGWGVSEEKIKMWKVNGRQTTDAKWWQKLNKNEFILPSIGKFNSTLKLNCIACI